MLVYDTLDSMERHGTLDSLVKSMAWLICLNALIASRAGTNTALLRCTKQLLLSAASRKQHFHTRDLLKTKLQAKDGCVQLAEVIKTHTAEGSGKRLAGALREKNRLSQPPHSDRIFQLI